MALGGESAAFFTQNAVTGNTSAAKFIPEIWSDEVVAAYKINLKMGGLVKRLPMKGKKGDRINIPKPTRGAANAKGEGVAVTIQANVESEVIILIDQHFDPRRVCMTDNRLKVIAKAVVGAAGEYQQPGIGVRIDRREHRGLRHRPIEPETSVHGGRQIHRLGAEQHHRVMHRLVARLVNNDLAARPHQLLQNHLVRG